MTETTTPPVEQRLRIEARPDLVWTFWTDPARMSEWWGVAVDAVTTVGGAFAIRMESGAVMAGEYTALDRPHRVAFTFGWEGGELGAIVPAGSTRVEVTLDPDGDATVLTLRHFDLPAATAADHGAGWAGALPGLVAAAEAAARASGT